MRVTRLVGVVAMRSARALLASLGWWTRCRAMRRVGVECGSGARHQQLARACRSCAACYRTSWPSHAFDCSLLLSFSFLWHGSEQENSFLMLLFHAAYIVQQRLPGRSVRLPRCTGTMAICCSRRLGCIKVILSILAANTLFFSFFLLFAGFAASFFFIFFPPFSQSLFSLEEDGPGTRHGEASFSGPLSFFFLFISIYFLH
jgi:hypothetical protein